MFAGLSVEAKLLYGFLLDRASLSCRNDWRDSEGRVFIYYTVKNVCEDLCCAKQKAIKTLDELENVQLLQRKKQGVGKPNKLYVMLPDISYPHRENFIPLVQ